MSGRSMRLLAMLSLGLSAGTSHGSGEGDPLFVSVGDPGTSVVSLDLGETLPVALTVMTPEGDAPDVGHLFWYSNLDGQLGDMTLDTRGEATMEVSFRTAGEHLLTLHAVDGDGRSGTRLVQADVGAGALPTVRVVSPRDGSQIGSVDRMVSFKAHINVPDGATVHGVWSSATGGPLPVGGEAGPFGPLTEDTTLEFDASLPAGQSLLVLRLWTEEGRVCTWLQDVEVE